MTERKKPEVLEGEIIHDKKHSPGSKPPRSQQYISEKTVGVGILIIILAAAGYLSYGPVRDWIAGRAGDKPLTLAAEPEAGAPGIEGRVGALEERTSALESGTEGASAVRDISTRLDALEQKLGELQAALVAGGPAGAASETRFAALESDIAALRAELARAALAQPAESSSELARAVAALAAPLYQSRPFEGEFESVRILVLGMPALDQAMLSDPLAALSDFTATGIPDLASIRERFSAASVAALRVEGLSDDAGWWERTWARLKGVVVIRRTDGTAGNPLEEVLLGADALLERGDVAGAADLIDRLPAPEHDAFGEWLTLARARARALAAFTKLIAYVPRQRNGASAP